MAKARIELEDDVGIDSNSSDTKLPEAEKKKQHTRYPRRRFVTHKQIVCSPSWFPFPPVSVPGDLHKVESILSLA